MAKTWKPTVAGILSIIAGAVAIFTGAGSLARAEFVNRVLFHWRWEVVGILALVVGIIAVTGGIFALMRKAWGLALAGAICALFPPHVAILGILAIIFVALSRDEFKYSAAPSNNTTTT